MPSTLVPEKVIGERQGASVGDIFKRSGAPKPAASAF
jgi:hypothetical protein